MRYYIWLLLICPIISFAQSTPSINNLQLDTTKGVTSCVWYGMDDDLQDTYMRDNQRAVPDYTGIAFVGGMTNWTFVPMSIDPVDPFQFHFGMEIVPGEGAGSDFGEFKFATQSDIWSFDWAYNLKATEANAPYTSTEMTFVKEHNPDLKWFLKSNEYGPYKIRVDLHGEPRMFMTPYKDHEVIYMVGSAVPSGCGLDDAIPMNKDGFVHTWEGRLNDGELKFSLDKRSDWNGAWFMAPMENAEPTGRVENMFYIHRSDEAFKAPYEEAGIAINDVDRMWRISAGRYKIMLNELTEKITILKKYDFGQDDDYTLSGLEYWFDEEDISKRRSCSFGPQMIDVSSLADGIHTIHVQGKGNNDIFPARSSMFFVLNMERNGEDSSVSGLEYWFDDEDVSMRRSCSFGPQMIDVSSLADGIHTIHVQGKGNNDIFPARSSMFFVLNMEGNGEDSSVSGLEYWFDDEDVSMRRSCSFGPQMIDVSALADGIHTIHVQGKGNNDIFPARSSMFFVLNMGGNGEDGSVSGLEYWFDEEDVTMRRSCSFGPQMIDVSSLGNGLHVIHSQVVYPSGRVGNVRSSFFCKWIETSLPDGLSNAIVAYSYFVNDQFIARTQIPNPDSIFHLMTMLPVPLQPIRCSSFHFTLQDSIPVLYARDNFRICFYDAYGYSAAAESDYVNYQVSDTVHADMLYSGQPKTFSRLPQNGIQWYALNASFGDSLIFQLSQSATYELFSPSGEKVFKVEGTDARLEKGLHVFETGVFYLAVHDVTGSNSSTQVRYTHIDRFAVLRQDVYTVGNGGCSTIRFEGNGFKDLYAIDLVSTTNDTINHLDVGHESDASTTVTFDFNNVTPGNYDAIFHFSLENLVISNAIKVDTARDIILETSVNYPSTFLRGTSVTYSVSIANKGNMTAYMVPIYSYIQTMNEEAISNIKIEGLNLPSYYDYFDKENLPDSFRSELKMFSDKLGDMHYYMVQETIDNVSGDSICVWSNLFFAEIAPNTEKKILFTIYSTEEVYAYFTVPSDWNSLVRDEEVSVTKRMVKRSSIKDQYCCIKERVECIGTITVNTLDLANTLVPGNINLALVDCAAGLLNQTISAIGTLACDDDDHRFETDFATRVRRAASGISVAGAISSCLNFLDVPKIGDLVHLCNALTHPLTTYDCIKSFATRKPNCPPNPGGGGGGSSPYQPVDPNDILGYLSESGSYYIADSLVQLNYTIEFENDSTLATSSAHTVVLVDTLDTNLFDLSSLRTTEIVIGQNSYPVSGNGDLLMTIDCRPKINALVEVSGDVTPSTGIASWTFRSLDPFTLQETSEISNGFLPINDSLNSGTGHVSFTICRKHGLPDGTRIDNKAAIYFDANDPILTPTWTNFVDAVKPKSRILSSSVDNDSTLLELSGEDNRSGLWYHSLYARDSVSLKPILLTERVFDGLCGIGSDSQYSSYFVIATDSAGNHELMKPYSEYVDSLGVRIYHKVTTSADTTMGYVIGGGYYLEGDSARLFAIPYDGYQFSSWNVGLTDNPYFFLVDEDKFVEAFFTLNSTGLDNVKDFDGFSIVGNKLQVFDYVSSFYLFDIMGRDFANGSQRTFVLPSGVYFLNINKATYKLLIP